MKPALFLDRDGVINIEKNYLYKIEEFEFNEGIFSLCHHMKRLGYLIVIVTNQSGIARGYYSEEDFHHLTTWMLQRFEEEGITIDKVAYCPHHPDISGECACRKPKPEMILSAVKSLNIDISRSVLIGDKLRDIEAGERAGVGLNCLVESNDLSLVVKLLGIDK